MALFDALSSKDKPLKRITHKMGPFGRTGTVRKFTCQRCSMEQDARLYATKDVIRHTREDTVCELVC